MPYEKELRFSPKEEKNISVKLKEKIYSITVDIPETILVGKAIPLKVIAYKYYGGGEHLKGDDYEVKIKGDSVKYERGKIIAKSCGRSIISVKYGDVESQSTIKVICGYINVASNPPYASIYVNDSFAGNTPKKIPVYSQKVAVKVTKYGYAPSQKTVFIQKGETKNVSFTLKELTKKIVVKAPSSMHKGETANISIEAVTYTNKTRNLSLKDVKIQIKGDSIKIENGKIIPVKPGKSTIKVEYKGIVEEKDITILLTNSISISVGSTMMGEFGINAEYSTKFFFASAGYYITPSLISVEGGVKFSLWAVETKLGASYFIGAESPFGIFTETGIKLGMIEPYLKIIVPVGFIGAVDGIPAILYGGVSLNIGF